MQIKTYRKMLGLTQEQLADFLDIKRSNLSMAESGKRSLPTKAMIKFGDLIKVLHVNESILKPSERVKKEIQRQKEKAKAQLIAHSQKCLQDIDFLEQKLKKLETSFNKTLAQINSLSTGAKPEKRKAQLLLELMEYSAIGKLERFSKDAQILLEFKISALKLEVQCANEMAEKIE